MADPIKAAKNIFDQFLSKHDPVAMPDYDPNAKDSQAQAAGRKGGLKGGKARAKRLNSERRSAIAKIAANARWEKSPSKIKKVPV